MIIQAMWYNVTEIHKNLRSSRNNNNNSNRNNSNRNNGTTKENELIDKNSLIMIKNFFVIFATQNAFSQIPQP